MKKVIALAILMCSTPVIAAETQWTPLIESSDGTLYYGKNGSYKHQITDNGIHVITIDGVIITLDGNISNYSWGLNAAQCAEGSGMLSSVQEVNIEDSYSTHEFSLNKKSNSTIADKLAEVLCTLYSEETKKI